MTEDETEKFDDIHGPRPPPLLHPDDEPFPHTMCTGTRDG